MAIANEPTSAQATEARPQPAGVELSQDAGAERTLSLDASERRLLSDLFAIISEHAADSSVEIDRERVKDPFVFACEHHTDQRSKSGEDFSVHPVDVAHICGSMPLDPETLCTALLHDTVEDTSASIEE